MTATQLSIYKKYIQARYSFREYSFKIISKLSSGRSNRKMESTYNVLASWLDLLGDTIKEPINITSRTPNPISVVVSSSSMVTYPATVNVFITTLEGFRELIGKLNIEENQSLLNIDVFHPTIGATLDVQNNSLSFTFPKGSKYNGGSVTISNASVSAHPRVSGGVDYYVSPIQPLSVNAIKHWDALLDKVAVEMGISYSNNKYLEVKAEFKKTPQEREVLRLNDNKSLTTEDGRPLDV